jgi:hypothetical protein
LERYIRGLKLLRQNSIVISYLVTTTYPKKHHLGPQNGPESSGPEKLLKIVNCEKTEKLKEAMVGIQVE